MRTTGYHTAHFDPFGPTLTLGLILDALPDFKAVLMPKQTSKHISWCQAFFDDPDRYPQPETAEENVLYFTDASNGLNALQTHRSAIIAVVDTPEGEFQRCVDILDAEQAGRLLILDQPEKPLSLACIVSLAQLRVQKVQSWSMALKAAAGKDDSIQDLLNLGEQMFGNFMLVTDGSYALLGHTHSIASASPLNAALVERGYHDADAISRARRLGVFGQWEKQHGVQMFQADETIPVPYMSYVMKQSGQYCGHVVMECNNEPPSVLQKSLFEIFALACNEAIARKRQTNLQMETPYHSYLTRLIDDPRCNQDFIDNQALITGVPAEGCFRLAVLDVGGTGLEAQLPYLGSSLMRAFPTAYVFLYDSLLLMLLHSETYSPERECATAKTLRDFCASSGCFAYVSDEFWRIRDIHLAFRQTQTISEHKLHVDIWKRPEDNMATRWVFSFDDVFPFVCYENSYGAEFRNYCINHSSLERLMPQRTGNDAGDLRFLHCYLFNERRTTPTAQQLGLHRNSIVYRANMLRDRYGIDLDRPSVRERLMECMKIKIATNPTFNDILADGWGAAE